MTSPLDEAGALSALGVTAAELDSFETLHSFITSQDDILPDQPLDHGLQPQQQQEHISPSYFDVDRFLLATDVTPTPSNHPSPDQHNAFAQDTIGNNFQDDALALCDFGFQYPDLTTNPKFDNYDSYAIATTTATANASVDPGGGYVPEESLQPYQRHQLLGHRRSVSVPPVEPHEPQMIFTRAGTPLGQSTVRKYTTRPRPLLKKAQKRKADSAVGAMMSTCGKRTRDNGSSASGGPASPHAAAVAAGGNTLRRSRKTPSGSDTRSVPTSAPAPGLNSQPKMVAEDREHISPPFRGSAAPPVAASFESDLSRPQEQAQNQAPMETQTVNEEQKVLIERIDVGELRAQGGSGSMSTTRIGILADLDIVKGKIEDMRNEAVLALRRIAAAHGRQEDVGDETEQIRQDKRAQNATIKDLHSHLVPLPQHHTTNGNGFEPIFDLQDSAWPENGQAIRELDVKGIDQQLDFFGLPCSEDMYLHEKKMTFLRFIGASRELMRLVLD